MNEVLKFFRDGLEVFWPKPKKTVKRNAGTSKSSKTFKNLKKPRGKFL